MSVPMLQVSCEKGHRYLVRPDSRLEQDIEDGQLTDRKLNPSQCEGCIDSLRAIDARRGGFSRVFDTRYATEERPHGPYYGDLLSISMALR